METYRELIGEKNYTAIAGLCEKLSAQHGTKYDEASFIEGFTCAAAEILRPEIEAKKQK